MLKIEEVRRAADLEPYRQEWRDLAARSNGAGFFQTEEWLSPWLDHFWKDRALAFLFVRRDGKLVGLAPLVSDEEGKLGFPGCITQASNAYAFRAEFLDARGGAEILEDVIRHLRQTRGGLRLDLLNVPAGSPLLEGLPEVARRNGLSTLARQGTTSPVVDFSGGSWESYLHSRSKHLRSELRRKARRIEAAGAVTVSTAATPEECARAMEDVVSIDSRSWKRAVGGSLDLRPDRERFFRQVAQSSAARGWLRLYLLRLDSKPVASIYGVAFRKEYYILQTSYDEAYEQLSPGMILFERVLADACRQGMRVFLGTTSAEARDRELLQAEARWKAQLATEVLLRTSVCVYSRGQLRWHFRAIKERVRPFLRERMPVLLELASRLRRSAKPS
jgi:CelD/BcsL family acetyltransferase involved in cellulose biosynthesis